MVYSNSQYLEKHAFKRMINMFTVSLFWKDKQGRYLGANDYQLRMAGLEKESDIIGKTDYDMPWAKSADKITKVDQSILKSGIAKELEEEATLYDGTSVIMLSKKAPLLNENNQIIGIIGASFDVTKRKEFESSLYKEKSDTAAYLAEIIDKIPGSVYWKDKNGVYLGCNAFVLKMAGATEKTDIIGKTDYDMPWRDFAPDLSRIDSRIIEQQKAEEIEETPTLADGSKITMLTNKSPLKDSNSKVVGIIGVSLDISERKVLESKLVLSKEQAEQSNISKANFIKNIEHDIRTPFSGIYSLTEYLLSLEKDNSKRHYLKVIMEGSKSLLDYLNNIIEIVKSTGEQTFKVRCDLYSLVQDVLKMHKPFAETKKIRLVDLSEKTLPTYIMIDKTKLMTILINLVNNAIKFTDVGEVTIKIGIENIHKEDRSCVLKLEITDTGVGIPKNEQQNIYKKLFKLSHSNENKYAGNGIGLYIVRTMIEDLNGEIYLDSDVGKGSHFCCLIPATISLTNEVKL